METEEGLRHIESIADAELDVAGGRVAVAYTRTFERVAADGSGTDVARLATELGQSVRGGNHPHPSEAAAMADRLLSDAGSDVQYGTLTD